MEHFLELLGNPAIASVGALLVEAVLRLVPSEKPLSIMHVASKVLHVAAKVALGVGDLLDKVLPQNTK